MLPPLLLPPPPPPCSLVSTHSPLKWKSCHTTVRTQTLPWAHFKRQTRCVVRYGPSKSQSSQVGRKAHKLGPRYRSRLISCGSPRFSLCPPHTLHLLFLFLMPQIRPQLAHFLAILSSTSPLDHQPGPLYRRWQSVQPPPTPLDFLTVSAFSSFLSPVTF